MKHSAGPRDAKWHLVLDFGVSGGQQGVVGTVAHRHTWRAPAASSSVGLRKWRSSVIRESASLKKKEKLKI